jgi:nucleoid-associated protein YgaU
MKDEIYGTYLRWRELYKANKDKLLYPERPELIHPGIVLEIPRP